MEVCVPGASVILKWALPPQDEQWVLQTLSLRDAMIRSKLRVLVPPLWLFEVGNTLQRTYPGSAANRLSLLVRYGLTESTITADVRQQAFQPCTERGVTFYDACYHALALARNGTFLTADEKYLNRVSSVGHARHLRDWQAPEPFAGH